MPQAEQSTWTAEDNLWLIQNWGTATESQIRNRFPNKTNQQISVQTNQLRRVGVCVPCRKADSVANVNRRPWTAAEIDTLIKNYGTASRERLLELLPDRTMRQCYRYATKLRERGVNVPTRNVDACARWTEEEDRILLDNWTTAKKEQLLAKLPGRQYRECITRISRLRKAGVSIPHRSGSLS